MRNWLILAFLLSTFASAQQAYRWTDENGQVHYSDRPQPGAVEVRLSGAQGYTPAASASPAAATNEQPQEDAPAPAAYTVFDIVQPSQQATLWNIGASLTVQVNIQPGLQPGHHLGAYLDGQLIDVRATSPQFQLTEVFRGLHDVQAVIIDGAGTEVLRSLPVSFMVQQTSILNPNRN